MRFTLFLAAAFLSAGSLRAQPYADPTPSAVPERFAEGVVTTGHYELTTAFTPDGRTAFFTVSTPRYGAFYAILESHYRDGAWTTPVVSSFSGEYSDADPFVSPDGSALYYVSLRPVDGTTPKDDFDLWKVERRGDGWGEPIHLGDAVNSDRHELFPTVTAGGTLYYTAYYDDSRGRGDLYRARPAGDGYAPPENLGDAVNSPHHDTTPYVAPDESYLIFAVWHPDGHGNGDLYVSFNRDGAWTTPKNLGAPVNSPVKEYCPIVSPDGRSLFYTSDRGFGDDGPPARRLTYDRLTDVLDAPGNGLGDVYRVDLDAVLRAVMEE